jgi:hypothetical protein
VALYDDSVFVLQVVGVRFFLTLIFGWLSVSGSLLLLVLLLNDE